MIVFKTGSIWDSKCDYRAIPTNMVGIMGAGLAAQCVQRYPDVLEPYKKACLIGMHDFDKPIWFHKKRIVLVATKNHFRMPSGIMDVTTSIVTLQYVISNLEGVSLALPKLGCGLGSLDWNNQVKPVILAAFTNIDNVVEVYE